MVISKACASPFEKKIAPIPLGFAQMAPGPHSSAQRDDSREECRRLPPTTKTRHYHIGHRHRRRIHLRSHIQPCTRGPTCPGCDGKQGRHIHQLRTSTTMRLSFASDPTFKALYCVHTTGTLARSPPCYPTSISHPTLR